MQNADINLYVISAKQDVVQKWGSDKQYSLIPSEGFDVSNGDKYIQYEDQVTEGYDEKAGLQMNHSGWATRNVNVWLPELSKAVQSHVQDTIRQKAGVKDYQNRLNDKNNNQEGLPKAIIRDNTNRQ